MFDVKDTDFFDMEDEGFDTIIEDDISFSGNIRVKKPLLIRGKVNGKIESISDVVIDSNSVINADIIASRVLVKGKVRGNVKADKLIFVTASASLDGDIDTQKFVLEPGCIFTGRCSMVKLENETKN